jgi:hypothetical protein
MWWGIRGRMLLKQGGDHAVGGPMFSHEISELALKV